jgi:hypothetical protein
MKCFTDRSKRNVQIAKSYLLIALCTLFFSLPLEACPLCKEAITTLDGLAKGITWGIGLMLAVPALVIGSITTIVVLAYRRNAYRLKTPSES